MYTTMSVYKIQKKIKRFEIFKPGTTLKNWYNKQTDKLKEEKHRGSQGSIPI